MSNEACATCGAAIANSAVTGILCQGCHDKEIAPKPGWKAWFTGPLYVGWVAVLIPFFFSIRLNALDYVALAGGGIGLASSAAGLALGLKAPADEKKKKLIAAAIVFFLGFVQLRASGVLILLLH
jgi:hypothetical protein